MVAHDVLCAGSANVVVAGGMESMSNAPYLLDRARSGYRMGHGRTLDHMFLDGLEDAYDKGRLMGTFAEDCAEAYQFTRAAQDAYALIAYHHLTWRAIVGSIFILAFVVLHIRQSRWTWIILMVLAVVAIAQVPLAYASAPPHSPVSLGFLSAGFGMAVGIAAFVYSLIIRKRFARGI